MKSGDIASTLVASKLRVALLGVVVLCVIVVGAFAAGILGIPSIATIDNTFGEVTNETTTIETDLVISNPNPVGIGLEGVSVNYTVSMNSIEMAQGNRDGVGVEPGNSTMNLETRMRNDAIPPWWTSHIRNDERTTVGINATITSDRLGRSTDVRRTHEIETDLIGAFNSEETRPVNADSALVDDPVLYINETRGQWGTVSETETPIDMAFEVYNPNVEPYVITEVGYDITMNDVAMGEGRTEEAYVIPSRGTETVELTTVLDNRQLDDWWVTHLDEEVHGHQVSELRIEFYAVIELPTGEEITVPLNELTYEEMIGTDIFDEGGDVGETDGSSTSDSGTNDAEGDDGTGSDSGSSDGGSDDGTDNETTDGTDGGTDNETDDGEDDGVLPL